MDEMVPKLDPEIVRITGSDELAMYPEVGQFVVVTSESVHPFTLVTVGDLA
jgi:hypothetical protein